MKLSCLLALLTTLHVEAIERPDIICEAPGEPSTFQAVVFSPDSQMVLTVDNESRIWRFADTNLVRTFSIFGGHAGPDAATFTTDGAKVIASGERDLRGVIVQWRVSDGTVVWEDSLRSGGSLAALPNTNEFALGTSGGIWLVPVDGSSEGRRLGNTNFPGFDVRVSRNGSVLAARETTPLSSGVVRVWRMSNETLIATWNQPASVRSLDVSPDGQLVAVGLLGNQTLLYAATNNSPLRTLATGQSDCLRFSPDGKLLLTVSLGKLMFWRVSDGKLLKVYEDGLSEYQTQADISRDGKHFAYDRNGTLVVARMPVLITNADVRTNALNLEWQGGSGLYQVQQTTNLSNGVWEPVAGPTNATALNVGLTNRAGFFRVQSLDPSP